MSEISFSKVTPKNNEQAEAISKGLHHLSKGNPDEPFGIFGKAGTGKTTIAEAIIEPYVGKRNILVMALSHKAKSVLEKKLVKAYGPDCVISKSIAGSLGMNMDLETGRFAVDKNFRGTPAIKVASIIICDEGSMVNEAAYQLITTSKKKNAKLLFLGDRRQLPPIRERGSEFADAISPIFFNKNFAVLNERVRQGEESPILPFSDYFGDNAIARVPVYNPVPHDQRKDTITDKGALTFADNLDDVIEATNRLYKISVETKNFDLIKTVTYQNDTRKRVNATIRNYLFGNAASREQYIVGDLLAFNDNYTLTDADEAIENSQEIQVTSCKKHHDGHYNTWEIGFIHESKPMHMLVLDKTEIRRHEVEVTKKFERAKSFPIGSPERFDELTGAWELKRKYAPVDYAYAITSHKAQGSTYNTTIVDEGDIMSVGAASIRARTQSLYTSITRPHTSCIMVSDQQPTNKLFESIELSISKI